MVFVKLRGGWGQSKFDIFWFFFLRLPLTINHVDHQNHFENFTYLKFIFTFPKVTIKGYFNLMTDGQSHL